MRKPRDYDAELKALDERARLLRDSRTRDLGLLVEGTGATALDAETLAGALLAATTADAKAKEAWRAKGQAFFRGSTRPRRDAPAQPGTGTATADTASSPDAGKLPL
jgi:Conjugal transfer protein TraD